jgi:hypothetical protein
MILLGHCQVVSSGFMGDTRPRLKAEYIENRSLYQKENDPLSP